MSSEFSNQFPLQETPLSGRIIRNTYEIQKKLGEGGFGETFLAHDRATGRPCVVKQLTWKDVSDWKTIELFEREARVLSQMDHPQIPKFFEFFTEESEGQKKIYLVQEYIEGTNFADEIRDGKHFTERQVIQFGLQVSKILEYLQNFSPAIIHRDIKPSNLLIDKDGTLHLIDFGAVRDKVLHWQKTEAGGFTVTGTYGYMPFEQFQGQAMPASDIYSLGITLIALLSHKEPHEMPMTGSRIQFEPFVNISRDFEAVLRKMTELRPEDRYVSAAALTEDLQAMLDGRNVSVGTVRTQKSSKAVARAFLLVSLLAVFAGFWLFRNPEPKIVAPVPAVTVPVQPVAPKISVPEYTGPIVRGKVLFDGKPVTDITDAQPSFWFRNETTGKEASADVIYDNGNFEIRGLSPGQYGVSVLYDLNPQNPVSYPGDLRAWEHFTVSSDATALIAVNTLRTIHMTRPVDNNIQIKDWSRQCETGNPIHAQKSLNIEWDSMGNDVYYDYSVARISCPYTALESMTSGTTSQNSIRLQLPPSKKGEYYLLNIHARKEGRNVGMLMTHGANGYGWDYRFRVE